MLGEDDDISVTSTAPSEQLSEYEVETILTERQFDHGTMYLVKWAGYPIERCTWEPADSFFSDETFADWEKKRKAIAEGRRSDFNLERWEKHLLALEEARDQRKRRREAKRKQLAFSRAQAGASKKQRVDANPSSSEPSHPSFSIHDPLPAPAKAPARTHSPNRPPVARHLPPKPPMVMFGGTQNRQGPWMAARHKRPTDSEGAPKQFSLATKWRHEKAKGSEPPPNMSKLELACPSEWPPRMGNHPSIPKIGNHLVSSPETDSPLLSPQEKSNSVWTNDDPGLSHQSSFSNFDTWKPAPLQSRKSWGPEKPLGDSWKPTRITKASTWRPDYEIPGDTRRDNSIESRREDPQYSSQFNVDRGCPEERFAVQSGPQKANPQVPSDKEYIPPLPPRRPITIKGAHNRRVRDDNLQSRFWNFGEIFCYMYFGPDKKSIGPVRLCGLDNITRSKILMSKQGRRIEIWFQDTCTLDEYRDLCSRAPFNARYSNGWIEGFDDTEPEVYKTGQELRRGNCLAISYPDDNTPRNVMVASSPFSPDFDFLRDDNTSSQETSIYLTARSPLARLNSSSLFERVSRPRIPTATQEPATPLTHSFPAPPEHRVREKRPQPTHPDQSPPLLPADDSSLDTQDFDAGQNYVHNQGETKEQAMSHEQLLSDKGEPLKSAQLLEAPAKQLEQDEYTGITGLTLGAELPVKAHGLSVENFDVNIFFKDVFKMSFDILSTTNGAKAGSEVFYLMCPTQEPTIQDECGVVIEFLKKNRAVIFSNRLEEDWERFVRTIHRGVVLFHESFVNYDEMPDLKTLIHKPFTFWSFSLTGVGDDHNKTYFQRLFPHGGAILLTEDFMLNEPDATVIVLSWFNEWTKKKFPGSWKIMLRPNVLDWLLRQPEPKEEPRKGVWLAMYSLIVQLSTIPDVVSTHSPEPIPSDGIYDEFSETRVISPRQIPFYGLRTEDDCVGFGLPRGLTQEQRNTDHLAEFFAGWALINSQRFRRFFVLTTLKPLDRWRRWNHVDVIGSATEFFRLYGIDWRVYWRKVKPSPKPSEAVASGGRRAV